MSAPATPAERAPSDPGMGFAAFVAFTALLMAINALSMDIMLPALPAMGESLGVENDNQRQWIVVAYMLGMGPTQLVYGPLADRFGRKPVLVAGLLIYVFFSLVATLAPTFSLMILARVLQGAGAASIRVLSVTIVRDCYVGRTMARVMSLAFVVFLAAPMVAPTIGQAMVSIGHWRWIFGVLAVYGLFITAWAVLRLKETQHPEDRRALSVGAVADAFRITLTNRQSVGYMGAQAVSFGALFGFVTSAQQIVDDVLKAHHLFGVIFAATALGMVAAQLTNARIVEPLGTRRVSHTAMFLMVIIAVIHVGIVLTGLVNTWVFVVMQALILFATGLMGPNFNAMAMEPMGRVAGTGSAVQGFVTTTGGALIGLGIGQMFDGTLLPFTLGVLACAVVTVALVMVTEKGRLFQPHHAPPAS